jgi:hypothetical protein
MFKIFKKKNKTVELSDLRQAEVSPKRDWGITIIIFISWILLSCLITGYIFLNVVKGDVSSTGESENDVTINQSRLHKAAEFINQRYYSE